MPEENALIVDRMQSAGAIPIGKTNVPEFGAGSQTFNTVFGTTLNPYDLSKTPGGSSGGAAAALATGMHPIADGSDLGGSLRNPGGYCNVVGFRPSPGRVPKISDVAWFDMTVDGPLARTVGDVALMMSVIAGPDLRSPSVSKTRARSSPVRSSAIFVACESPGAATWAGCRSIHARPRSSSPSAMSSQTSASSSSRPSPT